MNPLNPIETVQPYNSAVSDPSALEEKPRNSKRRKHRRHHHDREPDLKKSCMENLLNQEILYPLHDCQSLYLFEKKFRKTKNVEMGTCQIKDFGKQLVTRGTSTCIAVAAVAFNHQQEGSRIGLAHYSGEGPDLVQFFSRMLSEDTSEVKVTLVGGQGKSPEEDANCRVVLQSIETNPLLKIEKIIFNPWEVPDDWEDLETWKAINPSAAVGISEDGKVVVTDESEPVFRNLMGGFTKFANALTKLRDRVSQQILPP